MRRSRGAGSGSGHRAGIAVAFLLVLGSVVLFAVAVPMVLVGIAERRVAGQTYDVEFVEDADRDCDGSHGMYLRVPDGEPLFCQPSGIRGGSADLPGFTDDQVAELEALAKQLAMSSPGGLTTAHQQAIQARVDAILATVPPSERKYGDQPLAGTRRILVGAGMAGAALLGFLLWLRLALRG